MNRQELLERIAYFLNPDNGIGASLYFILNQDNERIVRHADIDENARVELEERYLGYIRDKFITNQDFHYQNISEADDRKNVVYRYDLDEKHENLNILEWILGNEEQPPFLFNQNSLNNIEGYLITLGNETNKIALYKKHMPFNLLRQDRFLLVPTSNQRFVKATNDTLTLDESFDFMLIDQSLIVLRLGTLERHFDFETVIRNQAQATINLINNIDLLEDIQQLQELAESTTNAKKLMKIKNSPVLNVPAVNIINFIKNHPELTGRINFNDDETRVRLTTGVSKKLFLKLLNDDYLFSELTELQYDTYAKDRLNNNGVTNP